MQKKHCIKSEKASLLERDVKRLIPSSDKVSKSACFSSVFIQFWNSFGSPEYDGTIKDELIDPILLVASDR